MKSNKKADLVDLACKVLDMIDNGEDFMVTKYETGALFNMLIQKEDAEPHVCDFLKAGLEKERVAYYFAYLICEPGYEVYAINKKKYLEADIKITLKDSCNVDKIVDEYWTKANVCKEQRKEETKNEEKNM